MGRPMDDLLTLLRCPRCGSDLEAEDRCSSGDHAFPRRDGFVDFLADAARPEAAEEVTDFYRKFPFPGYAPTDDADALLERSRRAAFLVQLDDAIPTDARVLDAGCGTGQVSAFLALTAPGRTVVGVDACDASLAAARGFADRVGIDNLRHFRGDLFALPAKEGAFDVVISRGVVHHTPDPDRATREVAARVRPGGRFLIGFYENVARLPHRARRALAKLKGGEPFRALDPILRRTDFTEEKKRIWIEDQYKHPLERMLALPHVTRVVEGEGFTWLRTIPPAVERGSMFDATPRPGGAGMFARRAGWALSGLNDPDAGLVAVVFQRS